MIAVTAISVPTEGTWSAAGPRSTVLGWDPELEMLTCVGVGARNIVPTDCHMPRNRVTEIR